MHTSPLFLLAAIFTLIVSALPIQPQQTLPTPDPGKPDLWNRAVSAYALGQDLVPGRLHLTFSLLSSKGDITENQEREIRTYLDEKTGKLQSEILWARDKGKDTTAKARGDEKKQQQKTEGKKGGKKRSLSLGHDELPLALKRQSDLSVRQTSERRTLEGRSCQGFDVTMKVPPGEGKKEASLLRGRAWIDEEKGLPMELTLRPDPLPSKVKAMNMTYTFHEDPNGHWVVKTFSMEGSGGFLFIKKHFRSQITLSDYFTHTKPE